MSSLSASISATDALPDPDTQRSIREPAMRSIDTLPEPLSATEDRAGVEMLSVTSPPGRSPGQPVQPARSGRTIRVRPCTVTLNRSSARDRKSVVDGKSVYVRGDLGGSRTINKKKKPRADK